MKFYVYTDGAARGNPGKSASGFRVLDVKRRVVLKKSFYNGIKTNNVAEYLAIIAALKILIEQYGSGNEIELFSDSELVVNQLNHNYKVKDKRLKELNKEATGIADKFLACTFRNVPRENENISEVDGRLNELLDSIKKNKKDNIVGRESQKKLFS